jgi:outer membrane protein assembly factor BamB
MKKHLICLTPIWILMLVFFGCNRPPKAPTISGPATARVNSTVDFTVQTTDPNNDDVAYQISWGDGTKDTWTLYFPSGQDIPKAHIYSKSGNYSVMAKAKDIREKESNWSNQHQISITSQAPNSPSTPSGPHTGYVDTSYTFSSSSTDPDGDSVAIRFDWGNGFISNWSNYVASGITVSCNYSYSNSGTFYIKAQAQDIWGDTSVWSSPLTTIITSNINQAPEIPAKPEGRTVVGVNAINEYTTTATDPNNDNIRYIFDWDDNTMDTTDYYASGDIANASHAWTDTGSFSVKVRAQDIKGALSGWSEPLTILVKENHVPNTPFTPWGPSIGQPNHQYTFKTIATDPDGDSVAVKFDWGITGRSHWTKFYASGDTIADTVTFSVSDTGMKSIRVMAKDILGDTSAWSNAFSFFVTAGAWAFIPGTNGEDVNSSPALILSGGAVSAIVFGCSDGFVYCLDTLGLLKWQYPSPDSNQGDAFNASPAIGTDGVVYIGNEDGVFFAINPNGTEKWRFTVGGGNEFNSSPALNEAAGRLYAGSENDTLYAVDITNGSPVWPYGAQDNISSSPAIASNGSIIFGDEGDSGRVYILNPDGTERRIFIADGPIFSSPALGGSTIYFAASDTFFYALDTNGTVHTFIPATSQRVHSSPTIGLNGVIYYGTDDGNLYALNSDLTPLSSWRTPSADGISSSVAIGADGLVYVVSDDYFLYGFNATTGGDPVWSVKITTGKGMRREQNVLTASPVIGPNGWIYAASDVGLYAFNRNTTLAATAWPMFHHDIRHTGKQ